MTHNITAAATTTNAIIGHLHKMCVILLKIRLK